MNAKDSELKGWEYTIPEGFEAEIKDGKVIVREKESEDERIRKEIITFLQRAHDRGSMPNEIYQSKRDGDWIAWLEKQKDIDKRVAAEVNRKVHDMMIEAIEKYNHIDLDSLDYGIKINFSDFKEVDKQKEQKLREESGTAEPDYGICDNYIPAALHHALKRHGWYVCYIGEDDEEIKERRDYVARNWSTDKDALTHEQKPAEWSEEDEKMLWGFTAWIPEEELAKYNITRNDILEKLKSLRPHPHWKPSEEQMEQLKSAADLAEFGPMVTTRKQYPALESLLDDLKKL